MKFGRLTVINRSGIHKSGQTIWKCKCDCGNETDVPVSSLTSGNTQSCGCLHKEKAGRQNGHGKSRDRLYQTWFKMIERCYNPNRKEYKYYGARGIQVCNEWKDDENGLDNFYKWANENGYTDDLSIDRIDVNGNYEPSNCRWATIKEQANNKRNNVFVTINEETKTLSQWAEAVGLSSSLLYSRYRSGMRGEELLSSTRPSFSKEKYIIWHIGKQKWIVRFYNKENRQKPIYLGIFKELSEAIKVRDEYLKQHNLS
jgi:hypothetical protein